MEIDVTRFYSLNWNDLNIWITIQERKNTRTHTHTISWFINVCKVERTAISPFAKNNLFCVFLCNDTQVSSQRVSFPHFWSYQWKPDYFNWVALEQLQWSVSLYEGKISWLTIHFFWHRRRFSVGNKNVAIVMLICIRNRDFLLWLLFQMFRKQ